MVLKVPSDGDSDPCFPNFGRKLADSSNEGNVEISSQENIPVESVDSYREGPSSTLQRKSQAKKKIPNVTPPLNEKRKKI